MVKNIVVISLLVLNCVFWINCSGGGNSGSSAIDISGIYSGPMTESGTCGNGFLDATILQNGTTLTGTWTTTTFGTTFPCQLNYSSQSLSGTIVGSTVQLNLIHNSASFTLTGSVSGTSISGSFTQSFSVGGGVATGGTFVLSKQ